MPGGVQDFRASQATRPISDIVDALGNVILSLCWIAEIAVQRSNRPHHDPPSTPQEETISLQSLSHALRLGIPPRHQDVIKESQQR